MSSGPCTQYAPSALRRAPQLPFATAALGAESPGVTRLSGIVTNTAPGLPACDLCADDHAAAGGHADRWQAPADYEPAQG